MDGKQELALLRGQIEQLVLRKHVNDMREKLGLQGPNLTERDRTQGAEQSAASTRRFYQDALQGREKEIVAIMDQLQICKDGSEEPQERLKDLVNVLTKFDELEVDMRILRYPVLIPQVKELAASLAVRTHLCELCTVTAERIAAIASGIIIFNPDKLWPPRRDHTYPLDTFVEGIRILPPETIEWTEPIPPNVMRHHSDMASLFTSARTCAMCEILRIAIILDCFRSYSKPLDQPIAPLTEVVMAIRSGKGLTEEADCILRHMKTGTEPIFLMIEGYGTQDENTLGHIRVLWQKPAVMVTEEKIRKAVFTKLKLYATESGQLKRFISTKRPILNSGAPEALDQIREWLGGCRANHEWCRRTISHQTLEDDDVHVLPARVIDVVVGEDSTQVILVETDGRSRGQWTALSHCWGPKENHPLKTTRANLPDHLVGISTQELPKTFQDAVVVTRELGFRYLWIDSLCIVQDDEDDWREQAQMMANIYQHAVVTLAASAAKDSTEGLFIERPYGKIIFPSIQVPFQMRDSHSSNVETLGTYAMSLDWRQEPFMKHMDPMFSSIYVRGWCTQELILSRRVVHFLDEGMVWICRQDAFDETGQMVINSSRHKQDDWATEWHRIVSDHSMRDFTYETDRLVSLDGIAKEVAKADNTSFRLEEYFYGMWMSCLPEDLLWASYRGHNRKTECPSWSWASCSSAIWNRFRDFDNMRPDDCLMRVAKIIGIDESTGALSISTKRIEMSYLEFSKMKRLSAEDLLGPKGRLAYRQPLIQGYSFSLANEELPGWIEVDNDRDATSMSTKVFYLHLAEAEYWTKPQIQHWGILLEYASPGNDTFRRIGVASMYNAKLLENVELQTTKIT